MISLCILTKDMNNIYPLINMFKENYSGNFEVCLGVNDPNNIRQDNIYNFIRITDKELFRGGIPAAHNRIAIECANTYKIVYLDSDEFPIWINPNLEEMLDYNYVIPVMRADFFTTEEIKSWNKEKLSYEEIVKNLSVLEKQGRVEISTQDRIYNCRYAKFNGLCHSIFHVPNHFRTPECGIIALHNKTVRDAKNKERMDELIYEQYMRQNINPFLSSSPAVLGWGKKIKKHRFDNWTEWDKALK